MDGWMVGWMDGWLVGRTYSIHVYTDREENVKNLGGRDKTGTTHTTDAVGNGEHYKS
jgi:hypothetical protein